MVARSSIWRTSKAGGGETRELGRVSDERGGQLTNQAFFKLRNNGPIALCLWHVFTTEWGSSSIREWEALNVMCIYQECIRSCLNIIIKCSSCRKTPHSNHYKKCSKVTAHNKASQFLDAQDAGEVFVDGKRFRVRRQELLEVRGYGARWRITICRSISQSPWCWRQYICSSLDGALHSGDIFRYVAPKSRDAVTIYLFYDEIG